MSSFTTALRFEEMGEQEWMILEPFVYWRGSVNDGDPLVVPRGFVTDGASVPRMLWSIFPPVGDKYSKAAVIHDMLYSTQMYSREESDSIFLEAMKVLGVAFWKRWAIYSAVRVGGGKAWAEKDVQEVVRLRTWVDSETTKYLQEML